MNHKKRIVLPILVLTLVTSFCHSQNIQYRSKIRPNVKAKLDSLYPHASGIVLEQAIISDTTQTIAFGCNCTETEGMIILVFDTNANLRYKEVHYHSIKNLPDTIVSYMKKKADSHTKFFDNYMIKYVNRKGEISYGILMTQPSTGPGYKGIDEYILKFKGTGKLISKEKQEPERL